MKNVLYPLFATMLLLASGCTTLHKTNKFNNVKVDDGATPVSTVEIVNSGWYILAFIPLGSGDYEEPNRCTCKLFEDTVSVENNLRVLKDAMIKERVREVTNLTTHKTDEEFMGFLLTRRSYHTSAVLIRPEETPADKEIKQ